MSDFRSDLNPPPKFENELPVGYVGATIMPGKNPKVHQKIAAAYFNKFI